jgi:hypothetical protein
VRSISVNNHDIASTNGDSHVSGKTKVGLMIPKRFLKYRWPYKNCLQSASPLGMLVSISTQVAPTGSASRRITVSCRSTSMLLSLEHTELARLHLGLEPLIQQRVKLLEPLILLGLGAREPVLRVPFH